MRLRRLLLSAFVVLLSAGISFARQQTVSAPAVRTQSDSLGDAARKARAEKKPARKSAKVFTNDDMSRIKDTPNPVRHRAASASAAGKSARRAKQAGRAPADAPVTAARPIEN